MTIKVSSSPKTESVVLFNQTGGMYSGDFCFTGVCVYMFLGESLLPGMLFLHIETLYQSSSDILCKS